MELIAIVTGLAVLQTFLFAFQVGQARVKHEVNAPAMSGHPEFDRTVRVHANTVEQLVIFLPGLWMFGYYVHELTGAIVGMLFIIGRFIYRNAYINEPTRRATGFGIGALSMGALVLGGMFGAATKLI